MQVISNFVCVSRVIMIFTWIQLTLNFLCSNCSCSSVTQSALAVCVVGGLIIVVVVSLAIFVLLRRKQIKRRRTLRRLLQEREVDALLKLPKISNTYITKLNKHYSNIVIVTADNQSFKYFCCS